MFKKILSVFLSSLVFFLFGCNPQLTLIRKEPPVTNALSHLDMPVLFGQAPKNSCENPTKIVGQIQITSETDKDNSSSSATTNYEHNLLKSLEDLNDKNMKIFLPTAIINKSHQGVIILKLRLIGDDLSLKTEINGCPK